MILSCHPKVNSTPRLRTSAIFSVEPVTLPMDRGMDGVNSIPVVILLYQSNSPVSLLLKKPKSIPTLVVVVDSHSRKLFPSLLIASPVVGEELITTLLVL